MDNETVHNALINKESRKRENQKAKLEATKHNVTKSLSKALKIDQNNNLRKNLQKDFLEATQRTKNGQVDQLLNRVARVGGFTNRGYQEEETITGWEGRPWESDDFDPLDD